MKLNPIMVSLLALIILLASSRMIIGGVPRLEAAPGTWTSLGLTGNHDLHSITVDPNNPAVIYVGTGQDGLFKSIDGGTTWNAIGAGIPNPLAAYWTDIVVDPTNSNIVYAVGTANIFAGPGAANDNTGIAFKSLDGGASWFQIKNGFVENFGPGSARDISSLIIDPTNSNVLYLTMECSVYKTVNGGASWIRTTGLACGPTVVRANPQNPAILYTRTSAQGIMKTTDGGATPWTSASSFGQGSVDYGLAIDPLNPSRLYANTPAGVFRSSDAGLSWTVVNASLDRIYKALITDPVRPNTVYAGQSLNGGLGVYSSSDGGLTWTNITANLPNFGVHRLFISPSSPNLLYAATQSNGGVFVYGLAPFDQTPPSISATATKADTTPYLSGTWASQTVTVRFTCSDTGGSGLAGSCPADQVFPIDGTFTSAAHTVADNAGNVSAPSNTFSVRIDKTKPTAVITAPGDLSVNPVGVVTTFTCSDGAGSGMASCNAVLSDADVLSPDIPIASVAGASYTVTEAGVYTLTVTPIDVAENVGTPVVRQFVVYDPNGGFVTGGGWFNSPAGACKIATCTDGTVGKATFGFVSKYKPGANVPTGSTEFQFQAGGLNFKSSTYEWLVVAGAKAQFQGTGTINAAGSYSFILTAVDGQRPGGGDSDKFRIKIWSGNQGSGLVYDNEIGKDDNSDPSTLLGGGSIVIHD